METKTEKNEMNHPRVVSRAEWLAARLELLKAEKELTRRSRHNTPLLVCSQAENLFHGGGMKWRTQMVSGSATGASSSSA